MKSSIKRLFLVKLIATFSVILVIAFAIILLYSDRYISQKALSGLEAQSIRALGTMGGFVEGKLQTTRRFVASLYNNNYYTVIPAQMKDSANLSYTQKMEFHVTVSDFLQSAMNSDLSIINIAIAEQSCAPLTMISKGASNTATLSEAIKNQLQTQAGALGTFGPTLFPAYINESLQYRQYLLPVYSRIKSIDMMSDVGYLLVDYSCGTLDLSLNEYLGSTLSPRLLILMENGTTIYDSARDSIQSTFPGFDQMIMGGPGLSHVGDSYVNLERDEKQQFYYLAVYDAGAVDREVASERYLIYMLILLLGGAALLISSLMVRHYYRRIGALHDAIYQIGRGDLCVRAPEIGDNDEIRMISGNLNVLVDRLEQNIDSAYRAGQDSQRNEMLRKDAELRMANAELYALQTQVNPHFLHNALESIRMRALTLGNEDVARMSYILSTLFKYSLSSNMIASTSEELAMCRLYLELIQIRYPGRFEILLDAPEDTLGLGLPRHILQPILENALQHGLDLTRPNNRIELTLRREQGDLSIHISDNGQGIAEPHLQQIRNSLLNDSLPEARKIGLRNVHLRIVRLFGQEYGLRVDSVAGQGTVIHVRMPAMDREEMSLIVQRVDC